MTTTNSLQSKQTQDLLQKIEAADQKQNELLQQLIDEDELSFSELKQIKQNVKEQSVAFIMSALAVIGAFVWKDAIEEMIKTVYKTDHPTLKSKLITACIFTVFVAIVSYYLLKYQQDSQIKSIITKKLTT